MAAIRLVLRIAPPLRLVRALRQRTRVKTSLLILALLTPAAPRAADWLDFHAAPDGRAIHQYDWDSVRQTPDGFEADIRVLNGNRQSAAHLTVDCRAATWQLSKACPGGDEAILREAPEAIGDTAIAALQRTFCVRWREPEGAHWRELGRTHQGTVHYDERLETTPEGFVARVRLLGEEESYLSEIRIDCARGRFTMPSQIARHERSGLVVDKGPSSPQAIEPGSVPDLLRAGHGPVSATP